MPTEPEEPPAMPAPGVTAVNTKELLMRGVLNQPKQYDSRRQVPLQEGAFLPRKVDNTGLSVSRRQSDTHPEFLTPEQLKTRCRAHRPETSGVIQVSGKQLEELGLRIQPDPVEANAETGILADPGHSLLPDINFVDFATDIGRERIRVWAAQLVEIAQVAIAPG